MKMLIVTMKSLATVLLSLLVTGCYMPNNFSFDVPVANKTNITSIFCEDWHKIGDNIVKSTCHIDNLNAAEKKPVEIRAYDRQGFVIGKAFIGKATIGSKVRINKAMEMDRMETPATITLETAEVL